MIHDHYYTYIKDYERDEGKIFTESVYTPAMKKNEKSTPFLPHNDKGEIGWIPIPL